MAGRSISPMRTKVHCRNAAATRKAILTSARQAFARVGYGGAGLREIAKGDGRHCDAGQSIFRIEGASLPRGRRRNDGYAKRAHHKVPQFGRARHRHCRRAYLSNEGGALPLDGFLTMLYSLSTKRAGAIQREQIESHHHRAMTAAIRGAMAPPRAALVLSLIVGFQVMRQMIARAERPPKLIPRRSKKSLGHCFSFSSTDEPASVDSIYRRTKCSGSWAFSA